MPEQKEFIDLIYNLLKYLETNQDITLLATEEQLKEELNKLYEECENKISLNSKVI